MFILLEFPTVRKKNDECQLLRTMESLYYTRTPLISLLAVLEIRSSLEYKNNFKEGNDLSYLNHFLFQPVYVSVMSYTYIYIYDNKSIALTTFLPYGYASLTINKSSRYHVNSTW
jgi:hypothetical protein